MFGVGEMGLMPAEFWSLTVREFWLKHAAFMRAEDRVRSVMYEHAMTQVSDKKARRSVQNAINVLRRYPLKPWLPRPKSR